MANNNKGWLCEESLKSLSSRPILIYFEFRSKPSLITIICMDPRLTNYLRQNIVFSYPEMKRVSFSLFLSLSVFCYSTLFLIFTKSILLLLLLLFLLLLLLFFHVPGCSGMFRVPGFIDAPMFNDQRPLIEGLNGVNR